MAASTVEYSMSCVGSGVRHAPRSGSRRSSQQPESLLPRPAEWARSSTGSRARLVLPDLRAFLTVSVRPTCNPYCSSTYTDDGRRSATRQPSRPSSRGIASPDHATRRHICAWRRLGGRLCAGPRVCAGGYDRAFPEQRQGAPSVLCRLLSQPLSAEDVPESIVPLMARVLVDAVVR